MSSDDSLEDAASQLAAAIEDGVAAWVVASVERIHGAWTDAPLPAAIAENAARAGRQAKAEVGREVRTLLETDIDEQRTTPLSLLREAVRYPTAVLRAARVPDVDRDSVSEEMFPDDPYGLTPASLADIDPALQELGLRWGAAKAWTHKRRHGTRP